MHFFELQFCLIVFLVYVKCTESLKLCIDYDFKDCADIPNPKRCIDVYGYSFQDHQSINDRVSSIIMEHENCVVLYDRNDCSGMDLMLRGNFHLSNHEMNDRTSAVGPCAFGRQPDRYDTDDSQENTTTAPEPKQQPSVTSNSHPTDSYSGIVQLLKMLNDRVDLLESKSVNETKPSQEIINFGPLNIYYDSKPEMSNVTSYK